MPLDPDIAQLIDEIGQALHKFVDELHLTVVVVEQYLDFVREFGQNFYIMNRGRVVAEGSHAELVGRGGLYARLADLQFSQNLALAG